MTEAGYNIHEANDIELARYVKQMQGANDMLRKQLAAHDEKLARAQAELDRRALAAYWQAHPELLRVDVGDKLRVTRAFLDSKEVKQSRSWNYVEVVAVTAIYLDSEIVRVEEIGDPAVWGVGVSIAIASDMRRAWLAAHESE